MRVTLKDRVTRILVAAGLCLLGANHLTFAASDQGGLLQVKVQRLIVDPASQQPVVVLADSSEERALFIWIDFFEASAIHSEMQGISHVRPLTHDLLERIIQKAGLNIRQVVITNLKEGIYYAKIMMEREGTLLEVDARPSDSIVMALKFKAPIFVTETLLKEKGIPLVEEKGIEEDYGLTFQNLTPDLAKAFSFESTRGVLVSDVRKGSRAEEDGIERGDIFVEVGGQVVADVASMRATLQKTKGAIQVKVFRKARAMSTTIHLN